MKRLIAVLAALALCLGMTVPALAAEEPWIFTGDGASVSNAFPFEDVGGGAWYHDAVSYVYYHGLMNGVSSTSFSPNSNITRQDICVIFYRYAKNYSGKTLSTKTTAFTDDSKIASYAKDAVHAMKKIGVITGYTDGSFNPTGYATRAEVAAMFQRMYEWLYGEIMRFSVKNTELDNIFAATKQMKCL